MKLRDSENMFVLGAFLGVTALIAALLLALVSGWTAGPIRKAQEKNRNVVLKRLQLPVFDAIGKSVKFGEYTFNALFDHGKCIGFAGSGSNRAGYAGEISAMIGFSVDGRISAVQILNHKETPGLGANVCDRKFQRTITNLGEAVPEVPANPILDQFSGRDAAAAGEWKISKDGGEFIYKTGATVSARAVTMLVNDIAAAFTAGKREIQEKSVL